jgi:HSP20 family protein
MYALTRTKNGANDPFTSLARDFFSRPDLLTSFARGLEPQTNLTRTSLRSPRFDLVETPTQYVLQGDLPGVTEENLDITVHEGVLAIQGSHAEETVNEEDKYLVRERRAGSFERRLNLPENADPESISAKLKNGVLTVSIPKKEERKARKIQIG